MPHITFPGLPLISATAGVGSSVWATTPTAQTVHLFIFCLLSFNQGTRDNAGALPYTSQEIPAEASPCCHTVWRSYALCSFPHSRYSLTPASWDASQINCLHPNPCLRLCFQGNRLRHTHLSLIKCLWYIFISAYVFYLISHEWLILYFIVYHIYRNLFSYSSTRRQSVPNYKVMKIVIQKSLYSYAYMSIGKFSKVKLLCPRV